MDDRQTIRETLLEEMATLRERERKWRQWFDEAPISLWEQDYSEVKRGVEEIRAQGVTDFRAYFESRPDLCRELARLVRVKDVNRYTLRMYKAAGKEDFLAGITRVFSKESYESFVGNLVAVAEGKTHFQDERVHLTLNGDILRVRVHWRVAAGYEETYGRVMVSIVDITDLKRILETLRESEEKYRLILEHMEEGYHEVDLAGRFTFLNRKGQEFLGCSEGEWIGKSYRDYAADESESKRIFEAYHRVFLTGKPLRRFMWDIVTKDGERRTVEVSASLMTDKDGRPAGFRGLVRDITDQKKMEEERLALQAQLAQAQKMESVGRLAGGVAHDFNNMLSVILGHAEMGLMRLAPEDEMHRRLTQIRQTARRSADLVRQLLAFARRQTVSARVLDLNDTVEGMLKMLRRLLGENIDLVWIPGGHLWPIRMDPAQIDQILANLCVNARDAIPDVGRVTIETANATVSEEECRDRPGLRPGNYVLLTVSDDGCGMGPEVMEHLFEPFFTTKEVGKGTGLGLATVYGIVKQNNGYIQVSSSPGQGAMFRVYLPKGEGDREASSPGTATQAVPGGGETILLVEDEPDLLEVGMAMLQQLGYKVLAAATPGEAIKLADTHPGRIDLLMTDLVMPGMNGRDLSERLRAIYPGIRCLFMSGYTADIIGREGALDNGTPFIQKPFSIEDMAGKVRDALGH